MGEGAGEGGGGEVGGDVGGEGWGDLGLGGEGGGEFEAVEVFAGEEGTVVVGEVAAVAFELREEGVEGGGCGEGHEVGLGGGGGPDDEGVGVGGGAADVDVVVDLGSGGCGEAWAEYFALREFEERAGEGGVGDEEVSDEGVAVAFFDLGAGLRVPAEVVADGAALGALELGEAVDEGVVVDLDAGGVEDVDALAAIDEDVADAEGAFGYFEEEAVVGAMNPVVDEEAVDVADVVPDAAGVGVVYDEVFAAYDSVALVEDLDGGGEVAGDAFDVVAADDVAFE